MKRNVSRFILFLFYCIPFVFLAMNEDAVAGTLWFYLIMILGFSVLCYICIKTKNYAIIFIGNIASFISSCVFSLIFCTDKWEYYFKPFLPNQLIIFETAIAFLFQIIFVVSSIRKQNRNKGE